MAISDELFAIAIGYIVNYIVFYRSERLMGNIGFVLLSGALLAYSTTMTYSATNPVALAGWFLLIFSVFNLIIDLWKEYIKA